MCVKETKFGNSNLRAKQVSYGEKRRYHSTASDTVYWCVRLILVFQSMAQQSERPGQFHHYLPRFVVRRWVQEVKTVNRPSRKYVAPSLSLFGWHLLSATAD